MGELRRIEQPQLAEPHPARLAAGPAPQLEWIEIKRLVVDDDYQRPITRAGASNVRTIAARFSWSRFSPVIVAPVEGGLYAIIDGQHRTTAAASIGIERVPCNIVLATRGEQAEAFAAINGAVTRMHALAIHKAAALAGDGEARKIDTLAAAGGARIVAYPKGLRQIKPGETMAIGAISTILRLHGAATAALALRCITATRHNLPGALAASTIEALASAVADWRRFGAGEAEIITFVDALELAREVAKARTVEREPGTALKTMLADRLRARWAQRASDGRSPPGQAAPSGRAAEKSPDTLSDIPAGSRGGPVRQPVEAAPRAAAAAERVSVIGPGEASQAHAGAPPTPAAVASAAGTFSADWTEADEARCAELLRSGKTITQIGALMRKPYRLVSAAVDRLNSRRGGGVGRMRKRT